MIALPSRDGKIDDHFGHCEYFTLVEVMDQKIIQKTKLDSPEGCGCKSGVAPILAQAGVTLMLAGNMGQGAVNKLQENGIDVIRGCHGSVDAVLEAWLQGKLKDNQEVCDHHDCH